MSDVHIEFYSRVSNDAASIGRGGVALIGYSNVAIGQSPASAPIPSGSNMIRITPEAACYVIQANATPDFDATPKQYIAAGSSIEIYRDAALNIYVRDIVVADA